MGSSRRISNNKQRNIQQQYQQQQQQQVVLTPLMEGPEPEMQEEYYWNKKESSWDIFREWFKYLHHKQPTIYNNNMYGSSLPAAAAKSTQDLRLLLGVLGCPLAPIPLLTPTPPHDHEDDPLHCNRHFKDAPIEKSEADYIIQQYLAATGIVSKKQQSGNTLSSILTKKRNNMYVSGVVKMVRCETEVSSSATGKNVKCIGGRSASENGCFVIWQMGPSIWSLELLLAGNKVVAGSDGRTVWRHTPWLGTHAAKGPLRPLRRLIQGLDPKSTADLFTNAQCLGEKRVGDNDCFVLKVAADRSAVMERSEGAAEVLRHVLYGYFCQKSGLLVYLEDSHLTRVQLQTPEENEAIIYWETTIGSSIGDYRVVDGVLIAHEGRSIATVFRFEEDSVQHSRTRMEEVWRIDDVGFNVRGLSLDHFIPPADIYDAST